MGMSIECIYIEEKSEIKKALEDIDKANAIREVMEKDCETFWKYCKSRNAKFEYVIRALGEKECEYICDAKSLNYVKNRMILCAYNLQNEPSSIQPFKPKLDLPLDAAHKELEIAHRKHDEEIMRFCGVCIRELKRLIPTDLYQKMRQMHCEGGHESDVLMCNICYKPKLSSYAQ